MKLIIKTLFLAAFLFSQGMAQDSNIEGWEYEQFPELPFTLNHLELDLTVNTSQKVIKGVAEYRLTSRQPGLSNIVFNTADLSIESISSGEEQLDYHVSGDSLIIALQDTLGLNESFQMQIAWQSESYYGIHKDLSGVVWTSLNRNGLHHWLPVMDHPGLTTPLDAYITIPANMEAVFNGMQVEDEIVSTDEKKVHFKSEKPVSVTGISLAVGRFTKEEAISGFKKVILYTRENILLDEVRSGLLRMAVTELKKIENSLSFEYPYDALNVVILPDHYWQEKQSGAGVIYLYQNLGSLSVQLKRGLAAQWFGHYQRYVNTQDDLLKSEFLKTVLLRNSDTNQLQNKDSLQSISAWNTWQKGYENINNEFFRNTIENSVPDIAKKYSGVVQWEDYARYWYGETGTFWQDLPEVQQTVNVEPGNSKISYRLDADFNEMNSELQLVFTALDESYENLSSLDMNIHTFDGETTSNVAFTGTQDTVEVSVPSAVEYVTFSSADTNIESIELGKLPIFFLLNQIRSENPEDRAMAASLLKYHTENPDLQLALRDVMGDEQNPEVRAAIYETLASITNAANGTEETFLEAMRSDSQEIKLSAIRSLANYKGNEMVESTVRSAVIRAENDTVFNTALNTYRQITGNEELISLAERFEKTDSSGLKTLKVLKTMIAKDSTGRGFEIADRFTREEYPFTVRKQAFLLLYANDDDPVYWDAKLNLLIQDADPRMRYLALYAINKLDQGQRTDILSARIKEEFDPRIFQKIQQLLSD